MTQHEPNHSRGAIIADLACIVGEMADLQVEQARLAERQAAIQSRLGKMIRDLSATTAVIRAPLMPQAAAELQRAVRSAPKSGLQVEPVGAATSIAEHLALVTDAELQVEMNRRFLLRSSGKANAASSAQDATPAGFPPVAQNEGQPVRVGKASDAVPERGVGELVLTGQSEELRHDAGAGGESAASADTAPAPDERKETMEEPRVPRRPPEVRNAGGGLVQDGGSAPTKPAYRTMKDRVLDDFASTGSGSAEIAKRVGSTVNSVSAIVSTGRSVGDPRAKAGDEKRAARVTADKPTAPAAPPARTQTDEILDLWETTDLSAEEIAQKLGLNPGAPSARLSAARSVGDKRVAAGDLRRAGQHVQNHMPPADGHLIRVEVGSNTGRVFGPGGRWDTTVICAKALSVLCDGQLYGVQKMDEAAGLRKPHTSAELVPLMQAGLKKIGVDLVHTKGIGCRLRPLTAEAV